MPRELVGLPVGTGPDALAALPALRRALDGSGPAVRPVADASRPTAELAPGEDDAADPTVAGVETSGSTGEPKVVLLPRSALLASADAAHGRLGGAGTWLLALPAHHVAGLAVLVRSLRAGTTPVAVDPAAASDPDAFAAAADACVGDRRYTSIVPTQLHRLLDRGGAGVVALAGFDAVLVGGAALPHALLQRARACGVRAVATYGMTETCGGCVYDGRPLDGVEARIDVDGRVLLRGAVLARGYLGRADGAFRDLGGRREFATDDLGALADGVLRVLGRADDVIVTGGVKVAPAAVEAVLATHPAVVEACVVGTPDAEWGQVVAAAVVLREPVALDVLRALVRDRLGAPATPKRVVVVADLPRRGPGKADRAAVRAAVRALAAMP